MRLKIMCHSQCFFLKQNINSSLNFEMVWLPGCTASSSTVGIRVPLGLTMTVACRSSSSCDL